MPSIQVQPLPSRRARKRQAAAGAVVVVGRETPRRAGRVLRSNSGQIVIPADLSGRWTSMWLGLTLMTGAASSGLYLGWRFSEEILRWAEEWLGLA